MRSAVTLLLFLLAAGCKPTPQPPATGAHLRKPRVRVQTLALREIEYAIEAVGSLEAAEEISIPARVSGILDSVHFKEGDAVDEKTLLAEIESRKFRLGEERAQAELNRAGAQTLLAETVYKNRLALLEEGKKQKKDWVTEEQMVTWRADLEKARADQERARVDLELAKRNHYDARVRPPVAGLINRKLVSKGEFVKPETIVATILNVSTLHVRFTVPELEASRLSTGQMIQFTVRGAPGKICRANLFYMSQKADPATRAVECKAEVLEKDVAIRAGYFAHIRTVTRKQRSVTVPEQSILHSEKGFAVYVTDGKKAVSRPVTLGLRVDGQVEVVEGLHEGERVVVDGALTLRDGAEIEIVEGDAERPAGSAP